MSQSYNNSHKQNSELCTQWPYDLPRQILRYSTISQPSTKSWIYQDIGWIVYLTRPQQDAAYMGSEFTIVNYLGKIFIQQN